MVSTVAIMLLTFACVALLAFLVIDAMVSPERAVRQALRKLSEYEAHEVSVADPLLRPFRQRMLLPLRLRLQRIGHALTPKAYAESLHLQLLRAGVPLGLKPDSILALKIVLAFAGLAVFGPFAVFLLVVGAKFLGLVCALLVPASFFMPDLWLAHLASNRLRAIRLALPDMLDMLTISVEAGLGLDGAIDKLVQNSTGPLRDEFGEVLHEIRAGVARQEAFRGLSTRAPVPEVVSFVSAIVQADVFGISVSQVLRTQAKEMRARRRQHAEELAQKAPVKMAFPLMVCMLPATMIVVAGPAIVAIAKAFGIA